MRKIFLSVGVAFLTTFLFFSCVKRKPEDEVKLIKKLVERLQYGLAEKKEGVLDSLFIFSKEERAKAVTQLLSEINQFGEIESLALVHKRFEIVGDSAHLKMNLSGRQFQDSSWTDFLIPIEFFLKKSYKGWKIMGYGLP